MADAYTTFGNYLLLKQLAQDGMGTLWRAGEMEGASFKRIVWLRRLDQAGLDRAALGAEATSANQLARVLKATTVVRNQQCGREKGIPFLAWDYVPSQPLDQLLARVASEQFPVAIDNALLIAEKIAAGLAASLAVEVGGQPLTHGFLVPHLVMIGNDGEAMIAGFGMARGFLANLDRVAVQEAAAPYLAPEVLTSGQASRRGDVYSLGALLFHILCGHPLPADPAGRAAALAAPQLACEEGPVPQDVLGILRKALADRADDRHGSAAEFKKDLEKLLYGGAYSPTTFNLALFIDRLYRNEIEEEDKDLQREKNLDVSLYFKAPVEEAEEAAPAASDQKKWLIPAVAVGVLVVGLLAVVALRPSGQSKEERQEQQRQVNEMVKSMVAEELARRESEIKKQLEAEKAKTEELRQQIAEQQKVATTSGKKLTAEEQARADQMKREYDARVAAQRKTEEELAKVQQEKRTELAKAQAAAAQPQAVVPTAVPAAVLPTQAPAAVPTAAPVQPTAAPVAPATAPTAQTEPGEAAVGGLGVGVREGDYVEPTVVDSAPQVLVEAKPTTPRAAILAKTKAAGVVILKATVNEKGGVENVEVLRPFKVSGLGIDEACIEALKQYRFKPATKSGFKVKTSTTITIPVDLTKAR